MLNQKACLFRVGTTIYILNEHAKKFLHPGNLIKCLGFSGVLLELNWFSMWFPFYSNSVHFVCLILRDDYKTVFNVYVIFVLQGVLVKFTCIFTLGYFSKKYKKNLLKSYKYKNERFTSKFIKNKCI